MPQKKTTGTTSSKSTRKTSSKRSSRRTTKKPKVYIPAYKAILFCCVIITLCMGLLLFTTLKTSDSKAVDSITERFQEEKTNDTNDKTEIEKNNIEKTDKKESSRKTEIAKKTTSKTEQSSKNEKEQPSLQKEQKIETPQIKAEKQKLAEDIKKTEPVKSTEPPQNQPAAENQKDSLSLPPPKTSVQKSKYDFPAAKNGAQLIFVFDDGGQNLTHLKSFLNLPFPITIAVLPQITHSKEAAAQIRKSGNEVILHQPMQSINASVNPGPGAIKPDMNADQIVSLLFQNVTEIGPVSGMNNHEGSAITADSEKMATILQFCSQEGIYFLDSRTNVDTKVPYVARELGYSWYERNIFLDNTKTKENALIELKKGLDLANKNGNVIMIGHIWSADFLPAFLQEIYPELKAQGYTFSTVSKSKAKKN